MEYVLKKEVIGPIIVLITSYIIYFLLKKIIKKAFQIKNKKIDEKRQKTLESLILNIIKYCIVVLSILSILSIYGVDTKTFAASFGVVGVVVGLAFQDLLKDFISGASILLENQYRVGDVITIGDFKGEVLELGLKTTKIKAYTGEIKIIANRNILEVINHTLEDARAIVNIGVSYEEDLEKVEDTLNDLCQKLTKELSFIKGNVELLGITEFKDSSIEYQMTVTTEVNQQYTVERMIRKRIKQEFDQKGISIPYNQMVIHHG